MLTNEAGQPIHFLFDHNLERELAETLETIRYMQGHVIEVQRALGVKQRVGMRWGGERSNECLGAAHNLGAKHEQCGGFWRKAPCGCDCHRFSVKIQPKRASLCAGVK